MHAQQTDHSRRRRENFSAKIAFFVAEENVRWYNLHEVMCVSVLKSHRSTSGVQFLETARELEIFTLRNCMKFPKRVTFYLSQHIVSLSQSVLNNCKAANSVYPRNAHEVQMRRDFFIKANVSLQAMISQLDIAKGVVGDVPDKTWLEWMHLIAEEAKLISAMQKSDAQRYKDVK